MPAKKTKKVEKPENDGYKASEVFGITEKRADEIIAAFKHAQVDHPGEWVTILEVVGKTIKGEGEHAFYGYMFGRMYSEDQDPMQSLMRHLLHHR